MRGLREKFPEVQLRRSKETFVQWRRGWIQPKSHSPTPRELYTPRSRQNVGTCVCPSSPTQLGHEWKPGLTAAERAFKVELDGLGVGGNAGEIPACPPAVIPLRRVLCVLCLSAEQAGEVLQPAAVLQKEGRPAGTQR